MMQKKEDMPERMPELFKKECQNFLKKNATKKITKYTKKWQVGDGA